MTDFLTTSPFLKVHRAWPAMPHPYSPTPRFIAFNRCPTHTSQVHRVWPELIIISWSTLTADKAAAAFATGFYSHLGKQCASGPQGGKVTHIGWKRGVFVGEERPPAISATPSHVLTPPLSFFVVAFGPHPFDPHTPTHQLRRGCYAPPRRTPINNDRLNAAFKRKLRFPPPASRHG